MTAVRKKTYMKVGDGNNVRKKGRFKSIGVSLAFAAAANQSDRSIFNSDDSLVDDYWKDPFDRILSGKTPLRQQNLLLKSVRADYNRDSSIDCSPLFANGSGTAAGVCLAEGKRNRRKGSPKTIRRKNDNAKVINNKKPLLRSPPKIFRPDATPLNLEYTSNSLMCSCVDLHAGSKHNSMQACHSIAEEDLAADPSPKSDFRGFCDAYDVQPTSTPLSSLCITLPDDEQLKNLHNPRVNRLSGMKPKRLTYCESLQRKRAAIRNRSEQGQERKTEMNPADSDFWNISSLVISSPDLHSKRSNVDEELERPPHRSLRLEKSAIGLPSTSMQHENPSACSVLSHQDLVYVESSIGEEESQAMNSLEDQTEPVDDSNSCDISASKQANSALNSSLNRNFDREIESLNCLTASMGIESDLDERRKRESITSSQTERPSIQASSQASSCSAKTSANEGGEIVVEDINSLNLLTATLSLRDVDTESDVIMSLHNPTNTEPTVSLVTRRRAQRSRTCASSETDESDVIQSFVSRRIRRKLESRHTKNNDHMIALPEHRKKRCERSLAAEDDRLDSNHSGGVANQSARSSLVLRNNASKNNSMRKTKSKQRSSSIQLNDSTRTNARIIYDPVGSICGQTFTSEPDDLDQSARSVLRNNGLKKRSFVAMKKIAFKDGTETDPDRQTKCTEEVSNAFDSNMSDDCNTLTMRSTQFVRLKSSGTNGLLCPAVEEEKIETTFRKARSSILQNIALKKRCYIPLKRIAFNSSKKTDRLALQFVSISEGMISDRATVRNDNVNGSRRTCDQFDISNGLLSSPEPKNSTSRMGRISESEMSRRPIEFGQVVPDADKFQMLETENSQVLERTDETKAIRKTKSKQHSRKTSTPRSDERTRTTISKQRSSRKLSPQLVSNKNRSGSKKSSSATAETLQVNDDRNKTRGKTSQVARSYKKSDLNEKSLINLNHLSPAISAVQSSNPTKKTRTHLLTPIKKLTSSRTRRNIRPQSSTKDNQVSAKPSKPRRIIPTRAQRPAISDQPKNRKEPTALRDIQTNLQKPLRKRKLDIEINPKLKKINRIESSQELENIEIGPGTETGNRRSSRQKRANSKYSKSIGDRCQDLMEQNRKQSNRSRSSRNSKKLHKATLEQLEIDDIIESEIRRTLRVENSSEKNSDVDLLSESIAKQSQINQTKRKTRANTRLQNISTVDLTTTGVPRIDLDSEKRGVLITRRTRKQQRSSRNTTNQTSITDVIVIEDIEQNPSPLRTAESDETLESSSRKNSAIQTVCDRKLRVVIKRLKGNDPRLTKRPINVDNPPDSERGTSSAIILTPQVRLKRLRLDNENNTSKNRKVQINPEITMISPKNSTQSNQTHELSSFLQNENITSSMRPPSLDESIDRNDFIDAITKHTNDNPYKMNLTLRLNKSLRNKSSLHDPKDYSKTLLSNNSHESSVAARQTFESCSLLGQTLHENEPYVIPDESFVKQPNIVLSPGKWRKSLNRWRRCNSILLDKTTDENTSRANQQLQTTRNSSFMSLSHSSKENSCNVLQENLNTTSTANVISRYSRALRKKASFITTLPSSILESIEIDCDQRKDSSVLLLEPTDDGTPNLSSLSLLESAIGRNLPSSLSTFHQQQQKSVVVVDPPEIDTAKSRRTTSSSSASSNNFIFNETSSNETRHPYQHQLSVPLFRQPSLPRRRRTSVIERCHDLIAGHPVGDQLLFPEFVHIPYENSIRTQLSPRELLLRRCNQSEPVDFSTVYSDVALQQCRKIGEGVYGEVYMNKTARGEIVVLKIVPIEGTIEINGEAQKSYDQILPEIVIAMELSRLRDDKQFMTRGFVEINKVCCVQGRYPEHLVDLWELYRDNSGTENDHPEIFPDDQLYIVFEQTYGGQDLEAFTFQNALQSYSAFVQTALTLAIAEQKYQFEHRDLHWGNILLAPTDDEHIAFRVNGEEIKIASHGVKVTIIDFTLSRMIYDGCCLYNDLSNDNELFSATGDYQFDIYRFMKQHLKNQWTQFEPYTNILWLHYTIDKMISGARYRCSKSKKHRSAIHVMMQLRDDLLDYKSASDYVECLK